jgi:hypothetical protein
MARLEDAKLVEGWYHMKQVAGQTVKERRYRVTEPGVRAWEATRDFYAEHALLRGAAKARI